MFGVILESFFLVLIQYFSKQLLSDSCIVIFVCLSYSSHVPWLFFNDLCDLIDTQTTLLYKLTKHFNSTFLPLDLRIYMIYYIFLTFVLVIFRILEFWILLFQFIFFINLYIYKKSQGCVNYFHSLYITHGNLYNYNFFFVFSSLNHVQM
jgi:hypothetical protein